MDYPIPVGIIGCGPRGVQMAQILEVMPEFDLVAVSDPQEERLAKIKDRVPCIRQYYTSSEKMIEESGIAAVIVETPPELHFRFVMMALEKGIHVMGEIPAVNTYEEAVALWKGVNAHPEVVYTCGATANYRQKTRALEYLRTHGLVGKLVYAETEYVHGMIKPYKPRPDQGKRWRDNYEACRYCTHSLGPVLQFMEPEDEFAAVSCMGTGKHFPCGKPHHAMVSILRSRKNVVVRFLASFGGLYITGPYHTTKMFTDKGMFELYNEKIKFFSPEFTSFSETPEMVELPFGNYPLRFKTDFPEEKVMAAGGGAHGGADFYMLEDFADAIVHGKPSPVSIREGLAMTLPGVFAAESAAKGGELVQIRYPWQEE